MKSVTEGTAKTRRAALNYAARDVEADIAERAKQGQGTLLARLTLCLINEALSELVGVGGEAVERKVDEANNRAGSRLVKSAAQEVSR